CRGHFLDLHSFPTRRSSDLSSDYITVGNILSAVQGKPVEEFKKAELVDYQDNIKLQDFLKDNIIAKYGSNRAFYRSFDWHIGRLDRKSTRLNSSHVKISYAV